MQQTGAGAEIIVCAEGPFDVESLTRRLQEALARSGCPEPAVTITMVGSIPRLATGKLKRFIVLLAGRHQLEPVRARRVRPARTLVSFLLGHLQQLLGADHRRDGGMVGLHMLAPELHDLLVVLAADDVAALTDDSLCHVDIVADVVVQLCGRLVVRSGGAELAGQLPGAQGRIAFAWLVCNRHRAAAREELATAIWGEERPAATGQAVRALLSKLRSVIGRDSLPADGPLRLTLDDGASVDVEAAARRIHDAESGILRKEWERAWIASQIAMNVTRRSFLIGHHGAWVNERRAELVAVYSRALATLSAAALQLGETELPAAERAARELVAAEPLSEGAAALLMRALDALGERPAALVVYDEFRLRLREALGVAPGPQLLALHSELVMR